MLIFKLCKTNKFVRSFSKTMYTANPKVAVCQFTATNVKNDNLETVQRLVLEAVQKQAKIVFLPEGCDYIANNKAEAKALAETLDGYLMTQYKALAQQHKVWLSIGGFHELRIIDDEKEILQNSHILINRNGNIEAIYRKMHLFDVNLPEKNINLKESEYIAKGLEIVRPINSPVGPIGLMICYDLRFPELSIILRNMGASILTFPSAFTNTTGSAHWEILLRSRAIENQCYVIAAAQYGCHSANRASFGQAMIVDPWGRIVAQCPKYTEEIPQNEAVVVAAIDFDLITQIRREMPIFEHRRNDMYVLNVANQEMTGVNKVNNYIFGNKLIPSSIVFYKTNHSYAFTNIRCVVPGHVLVASLRPVQRLKDLSKEEIADLFQTVVKVQKIAENLYKVTSSTICVQDGKEAGQTIPHVHCHILPRKEGDFIVNDDIYHELEKHDKVENKPSRSLEEMQLEANRFKQNFL